LELLSGELPLICTGLSTCGISAKASECQLGIESELTDRGISFRSMKVGCLGLCYAEPLIYIKMPSQPMVCYGHLHLQDIESLADAVFDNNNINKQMGNWGQSIFPRSRRLWCRACHPSGTIP